MSILTQYDKTIPAIESRQQLVDLAAELGVRPDWHEPDEQDVDVIVRGNNFDNAFGNTPGYVLRTPGGPNEYGLPPERWTGKVVEKYVEIRKSGKPVARINLANLLAYASQKE